jgi:hypothetical protein
MARMTVENVRKAMWVLEFQWSGIFYCQIETELNVWNDIQIEE